MMEFNLQLFGGRGDDYDAPISPGERWSKGAGTSVAKDLKTALGKKRKVY